MTTSPLAEASSVSSWPLYGLRQRLGRVRDHRARYLRVEVTVRRRVVGDLHRSRHGARAVRARGADVTETDARRAQQIQSIRRSRDKPRRAHAARSALRAQAQRGGKGECLLYSEIHERTSASQPENHQYSR
jgi:hypothetical protein